MRTINRLNEEIARWAFEIIFKSNEKWVLAFTNPTAGPWKTIKTVSKATGREGEVYRFILEEDRPDIIMYSDELEAVIIFEAKDSLEKLLEKNQAKKSAAVVVKLADLLKSKGSNEFWRGRENYKIILGLLWGSTDTPESESEKTKLYDYYHNLVKNEDSVYKDLIIGIETLYAHGNLKCSAFYKAYNGAVDLFGKRIIQSLV
jgi:hypothetical protein